MKVGNGGITKMSARIVLSGGREVMHMKNNSIGYLKKKKMYEMLKSLVSTNLNMMKNATYRFYRGSEWLECTSDIEEHYKIYKLYHEGAFVSLDISQWDEEQEEFVEIERITYRMIDGQLVKNYQRTEAYKKTEEIKGWIENHNFA